MGRCAVLLGRPGALECSGVLWGAMGCSGVGFTPRNAYCFTLYTTSLTHDVPPPHPLTLNPTLPLIVSDRSGYSSRSGSGSDPESSSGSESSTDSDESSDNVLGGQGGEKGGLRRRAGKGSGGRGGSSDSGGSGGDGGGERRGRSRTQRGGSGGGGGGGDGGGGGGGGDVKPNKTKLDNAHAAAVEDELVTRPMAEEKLNNDPGVVEGHGLFVVWSWGLTFLLGMTLVGSMGGGFQTRFIAPAVPALALLVAAATHSRGPLGTVIGRNVLTACLCYGAMSM